MKRLFNFYLDDSDKVEVNLKLTRLIGEENKGQLASFIRVMIKQFIMTPDDKVNRNLLEAVKSEYTLTTKGNKRSRL